MHNFITFSTLYQLGCNMNKRCNVLSYVYVCKLLSIWPDCDLGITDKDFVSVGLV